MTLKSGDGIIVKSGGDVIAVVISRQDRHTDLLLRPCRYSSPPFQVWVLGVEVPRVRRRH